MNRKNKKIIDKKNKKNKYSNIKQFKKIYLYKQ